MSSMYRANPLSIERLFILTVILRTGNILCKTHDSWPRTTVLGADLRKVFVCDNEGTYLVPEPFLADRSR